MRGGIACHPCEGEWKGSMVCAYIEECRIILKACVLVAQQVEIPKCGCALHLPRKICLLYRL